ncbi:hypothetical protein PtA15_15A39 [Puccinia triticina]|uniref:Uncharacterized protein n=1 Tax=Puccinia triticina TaxID=208348 RepID=A0ABY7D442_9BASI|nr:uncharacterized protein PtA15_15A39 [Puccinia triticina]WAQ91650.1 hypothetical protein PtA15_15A39 [Puccinia triticina]WAR62449.1 hypothetical protein PtB15_15B33 [Puccinia triticina]
MPLNPAPPPHPTGHTHNPAPQQPPIPSFSATATPSTFFLLNPLTVLSLTPNPPRRPSSHPSANCLRRQKAPSL